MLLEIGILVNRYIEKSETAITYLFPINNSEKCHGSRTRS